MCKWVIEWNTEVKIENLKRCKLLRKRCKKPLCTERVEKWDVYEFKEDRKYETLKITSSLGSGSSKVVLRARIPSLERDYAVVKFKNGLDNSDEQYIMDLLSLNPEFVKVEVLSQYGMICELCKTDLGEAILKNDSLFKWNFQQKLQICCNLYGMVSKLHHRGYYHLDLKPENILITEDGLVKMGDFGTVRSNLLSSPKNLPCTPPYAAPEACGFGDSKLIDLEKFDAYSITLTGLFVLTGKNPYQENFFRLREYLCPLYDLKRESLPPELDEQVLMENPRLREILRQGLTWDPSKRSTVDQMRLEIESFLHPPTIWEPVITRFQKQIVSLPKIQNSTRLFVGFACILFFFGLVGFSKISLTNTCLRTPETINSDHLRYSDVNGEHSFSAPMSCEQIFNSVRFEYSPNNVFQFGNYFVKNEICRDLLCLGFQNTKKCSESEVSELGTLVRIVIGTKYPVEVEFVRDLANLLRHRGHPTLSNDLAKAGLQQSVSKEIGNDLREILVSNFIQLGKKTDAKQYLEEMTEDSTFCKGCYAFYHKELGLRVPHSETTTSEDSSAETKEKGSQNETKLPKFKVFKVRPPVVPKTVFPSTKQDSHAALLNLV